jgi:hypothetical protein
MNLLITGKGTSGSWQCRGVQLGAAAGARITKAPTLAQCKAADAIVVVKRIGEDMLATIRKSGTPWVFDAVDFYPQPGCSAWGDREAIEWVRRQLARLSPAGVIWPNRRMQQDCGDGWRGFVLQHHHRPGIASNPIRDRVEAVGYEGSPRYIEAWRPQIEHECSRRGWRFVVNPERLADVDIVLALRSGPWDCYATRRWKSNVKLANAHGSGTPFVGQPDDGYRETASGAEYWTESAAGLGICFEWLASQGAREAVSDRFLQRAYPVERAAADLVEGLHGLR